MGDLFVLCEFWHFTSAWEDKMLIVLQQQQQTKKIKIKKLSKLSQKKSSTLKSYQILKVGFELEGKENKLPSESVKI